MRVSDVKETKNYTGCIVTGAHCYAYFPFHKNRVIKNLSRDYSSEYILEQEYERALKLTYNSMRNFVDCDVGLYNTDHQFENAPQDNYSLIIELYVKGNVQVSIKVEVGKLSNIDTRALGSLVASLVYLLSNLTEQHNIKVEYLWTRRMGKTSIYGSSSVTYIVDFGYGRDDDFDSAIGISFDVPMEFRELDGERILLYADVPVKFGDKRVNTYLDIYPFMLSGYILPVPKDNMVYLLKLSKSGGLLIYGFNGDMEFDFQPPKELFALTLEDIKALNNM